MRALRFLTLVLAVAIILGFIFHNAVLAGLGSYLVKADPPEKADIALVLAGDGEGNRILKAAQLARQGYVSKILVSGPSGMYGLHECDLAIPFAVKAGYPESYFLHFENDARSTQEEAHDCDSAPAPVGRPQSVAGHQRLPYAPRWKDLPRRGARPAIRRRGRAGCQFHARWLVA